MLTPHKWINFWSCLNSKEVLYGQIFMDGITLDKWNSKITTVFENEARQLLRDFLYGSCIVNFKKTFTLCYINLTTDCGSVTSYVSKQIDSTQLRHRKRTAVMTQWIEAVTRHSLASTANQSPDNEYLDLHERNSFDSQKVITFSQSNEYNGNHPYPEPLTEVRLWSYVYENKIVSMTKVIKRPHIKIKSIDGNPLDFNCSKREFKTKNDLI